MAVSYPFGRMRVTFGAMSHVGRKRALNEDSFHVPGAERLAVVADGMGGHASGEVASRLAVETVVGHFRAASVDPPVTWPYKMGEGARAEQNRLVTAVKLANARIWETAQASAAQHGMGTTIVCALFLDGARVLVAHVGDSRCYRVRDGEMTQLTEDHSLLNDYMRLKGLGPDEVTDFPQKNVIVRALGMKEVVQVDVQADHARRGDAYVLCSDGLSGMVSDAEIARTVTAERDPDTAAGRLIDSANAHGGVDNITALVARIE
jgi:protein phosphatase